MCTYAYAKAKAVNPVEPQVRVRWVDGGMDGWVEVWVGGPG